MFVGIGGAVLCYCSLVIWCGRIGLRCCISAVPNRRQGRPLRRPPFNRVSVCVCRRVRRAVTASFPAAACLVTKGIVYYEIEYIIGIV